MCSIAICLKTGRPFERVVRMLDLRGITIAGLDEEPPKRLRMEHVLAINYFPSIPPEYN
jgi:hypothetical protein